MTLSGRSTLLAYAALLAAPAFFSTNVVFGRAAAELPPFLLAFIRWTITAALLFSFSFQQRKEMVRLARTQWRLLLLLGFLGMFVCGGGVYLALQQTTATNATLIYTLPPILVILIERVWRQRPLKLREIAGVFIAMLGVGITVSSGKLPGTGEASFNPGDILMLAAALSWALYLVIFKSARLSGPGPVALFALIAAFGALTLLPMALLELVMGARFPNTGQDWQLIAGIVLFASLIAFSAFQFGVHVLGSSVASIFMYLMPPFGLTFSALFLGEKLEDHHFAGIAGIMAGVILATFPTQVLSKAKGTHRG